MSVTTEQLRQQQTIKQKNQRKDLLLEVRAKAFELQSALSDLAEFGAVGLNRVQALDWLQETTRIYKQAGDEIKGA
jgi:hypothetical protein